MVQVIFEAIIKFRPHGKAKFNSLYGSHGYRLIDQQAYLHESRIMDVSILPTIDYISETELG